MSVYYEVPFLKGHGTGNDFIILPDPDGELELTEARVRRLCGRATGIGADGILRVVPSENSSDWFMDYRNADGSIAEMCGNGARVFARYLIETSRASGDFTIETRAGIHRVEQHDDSTISVEMGKPAAGLSGPDPMVHIAHFGWSGTAWWLPNPHAVVFVDDLAEAGELRDPPHVIAGDRFPDGQNIEFVVDLSQGTQLAAQMRVYERGVGETLSCGTGACAVALAVRQRHGSEGKSDVMVRVPGGLLSVRIDEADTVWLRGPAVLVASGNISRELWEGDDR